MGDAREAAERPIPRRDRWVWTFLSKHGWTLTIPIVLVLATAFGRDVVANPVGRTLVRWTPAIGMVFIAVVCWGWMARRDRIGFLSLFLPALALAGLSGFTTGVVGYLLGMVPIAFAAVFVFVPAAWPWWRVHVLRRRAWTPTQVFEAGLGVGVLKWTKALGAAEDGPLSSRHIVAAELAVDDLRRLTAPDRRWAALRDDYAALMARWIRTPREPVRAQEFVDMNAELAELTSRWQALRSAAEATH